VVSYKDFGKITEENQKDLLSLQIHMQILKIMHLAVPKHDVLVIIFKKSDHCFHSIG